MTTIPIKLPCKPHPKQLAIINSKARYNVIAGGRRFGKTEACKIRMAYRIPHRRCVWVSLTFDTGQSVWRYFASAFSAIPGTYINNSERLLTLPSGGSLRVFSGESRDNLRSYGFDDVVIDEAAFQHPDLWPYILRPMLLDAGDKAQADFLSSTNGRNWFYQLYNHAADPEQTDWQAWHFTSYDNPLLDRNELEDIRRNTAERIFQQEYMAEFLEDGGAVFRNLQACVNRWAGQDRPQGVVIGVDWGKVDDYTVLIALDTRTHNVLEIDRFNQIDWTLQRSRIVAMARRWNTQDIVAEENSIGQPNIEELRKANLSVRPFMTTSASKAQLINQLALAFEQADIGIPDNPVLLAELQAYTVERLPGGTFRYSAPSGMHDDCVIALALAWHGVVHPAYARVIEVPDIFGHDLNTSIFGHD